VIISQPTPVAKNVRTGPAAAASMDRPLHCDRRRLATGFCGERRGEGPGRRGIGFRDGDSHFGFSS